MQLAVQAVAFGLLSYSFLLSSKNVKFVKKYVHTRVDCGNLNSLTGLSQTNSRHFVLLLDKKAYLRFTQPSDQFKGLPQIWTLDLATNSWTQHFTQYSDTSVFVSPDFVITSVSNANVKELLPEQYSERLCTKFGEPILYVNLRLQKVPFEGSKQLFETSFFLLGSSKLLVLSNHKDPYDKVDKIPASVPQNFDMNSILYRFNNNNMNNNNTNNTTSIPK